MYLINAASNRISKLETKRFSELGFTERHHLQEWLANEPQSLGEELLIIQKEFDGFSETRERLDLLALDKDGNLVIIENKLDDTGRDVIWTPCARLCWKRSARASAFRFRNHKWTRMNTNHRKQHD